MHHGDDSKQLFASLNDDDQPEHELITKINDITVFFFGIFKKDEASQEAFCFECQNNKIQVKESSSIM